MKTNTIYYTLVQHSAFAGKGDPQFRQAVEAKPLMTKKEVAAVTAAGGRIFNSYIEADDAEYAENYPHGVLGLIPRAAGSFSPKQVQGQAIYVPKRG